MVKQTQYKSLNSAVSNESNHQRQDWNIDIWCRKLGITRSALETHTNIANLRKLLDFDKLDHLMTDKDKKIWNSVWHVVYKLQLTISVYNEKRLSSIVENCKRTEYILKRKQRQATRALKQRDEIGDHNNEAKGSQSAIDQLYGQLHMDDGSARIRAVQVIEVR